MASFTVRREDLFPSGTTVSVYLRSDWPTGVAISGSPPGSAVTTAVQSGATASFTGLAERTKYVAGASVGGAYRYVRFRTDSNAPDIQGASGASDIQQSSLVIPKFDDTFGQIGMWCIPNRTFAVSTIVPVANNYRFARFMPRRDMRIVKLGFVTTVAATNNDAVDVGLFDSTGAALIRTGATTGKANATAGTQTISITATQLTAGLVYYAAFAYGAVGGTAATIQTVTAGAAGTPQMFGTTAGVLEAGIAAAGTLPSSLSFAAASTTAFNLAVLES